MMGERKTWLPDALLVVLFLVCAAMTYRAWRPRADEGADDAVARAPVAATPAPTPAPTPDLNPERTVTLAALTFFESISQGRYSDAVSMFKDEERKKKWEENLDRVARYGNPIAKFQIENPVEGRHCRLELENREKARCDFAIYLIRRDRDVTEWASVTMNLELTGGLWKISYYQQETLDKEAYDKRKAEEARKLQAAELAREKLSASPASPSVPDAEGEPD